MPIFLPEHQVGFDGNLVGYPNLGSCMAVAVLTTRGIYGFHYTPAPIAQVTQFANYITGNMIPGEATLRLYGSCYWTNRYAANHKAQWITEMTNIAAGLHYTGRVTGFDTSSGSHGDAHGTYLEYRNNGHRCGIFYKRSGKVALYKPQNVPLPGVERIKPNQAILGQYQRALPQETKNIYDAMVGPNSQMHEAGFMGKHSFDIP